MNSIDPDKLIELLNRQQPINDYKVEGTVVLGSGNFPNSGNIAFNRCELDSLLLSTNANVVAFTDCKADRITINVEDAKVILFKNCRIFSVSTIIHGRPAPMTTQLKFEGDRSSIAELNLLCIGTYQKKIRNYFKKNM